MDEQLDEFDRESILDQFHGDRILRLLDRMLQPKPTSGRRQHPAELTVDPLAARYDVGSAVEVGFPGKPGPKPAPDDAPSYQLHFAMSSAPGDEGDWFEQYVQSFRFYVSQDSWSDQHGDVLNRVAGKGEGFDLRSGLALNKGVLIADAADDRSPEAYEYCTAAIQRKSNEWGRAVQNQFPRGLNYDLLTITRWRSSQSIEPIGSVCWRCCGYFRTSQPTCHTLAVAIV